MKSNFYLLNVFALSGTFAQFFGDYKYRLQNYNTGRLFVREETWFGKGPYGPVCRGTGTNVISGENGDRFGRLVCEELGFDFGFIGSAELYGKKLRRKVSETDSACVPEYVISGANCGADAGNIADCDIVNYRTDGGTCIRSKCDVFLHCKPKKRGTGKWSSWGEWESCHPEAFFQQRSRNCTNELECKGHWIEVQPCGQCVHKLELEEDYNAELIGAVDYDSYDSYDYNVRTSRSVRSANYLHDFCTCQLQSSGLSVELQRKRRNNKCPNSIIAGKKEQRFFHRGNNRYGKPLYKNDNATIFWSKFLFGKAHNKSGWGYAVNGRLMAITNSRQRCAEKMNGFKKLPKRLQRRVPQEDMRRI